MNLRELANKMSVSHGDVKALELAADKAEQFVFDLSSLIDGKDDELADLLEPVMEFLKGLAGIKDETVNLTIAPSVSYLTTSLE